MRWNIDQRDSVCVCVKRMAIGKSNFTNKKIPICVSLLLSSVGDTNFDASSSFRLLKNISFFGFVAFNAIEIEVNLHKILMENVCAQSLASSKIHMFDSFVLDNWNFFLILVRRTWNLKKYLLKYKENATALFWTKWKRKHLRWAPINTTTKNMKNC